MKITPFAFAVFAFLLFAVAIFIYAGSDKWEWIGDGGIAANNLAGLTAGGFAIAGGLSLVAAAIAGLGDKE